MAFSLSGSRCPRVFFPRTPLLGVFGAPGLVNALSVRVCMAVALRLFPGAFCLWLALLFQTLRSRRNESNNVPDEVVEALLLAVRTTGVELSKKYYMLKKQILKIVSGITVSSPSVNRAFFFFFFLLV